MQVNDTVKILQNCDNLYVDCLAKVLKLTSDGMILVQVTGEYVAGKAVILWFMPNELVKV